MMEGSNMVFGFLAELGATAIGIIVVVIVAVFLVIFLVPALLAILLGFLSFLVSNPIGWIILVLLIVGFCCCAGSNK
jgi:hypothetical protein